MKLSNRHAIVGEIGANHLLFAVADVDELTIDHLVNFRAKDFDSVHQALFSYLKSVGTPSKIVSLAVAGSVQDDLVRIFNSPWTFTTEQLRSALSLERVEATTDAEALARVAGLLPGHDLHRIAGVASAAGGPRAVIVIGEEMRTAIAFPDGQKSLVLSTGTGDMFFGAADGEDLWFVEQVRGDLRDRNAGRMLSGEGLMALYKAASRQAAIAPSCSTIADVLAAASERADPAANAALRRYALWLARLSSDVALATGAWGGLYLAGEVPAKVIPFLDNGSFKAAFETAGGASRVFDVPAYVVTSLGAALRGAAMAFG